ncbi:cellulose biosynthesis cyclic di-GMP-binding regulatory protein BcsB [Afifella sp. JA880]|uniref:cellulose biosynthesis cyclic di-GMP-binding regulatory protein BcsB n=1 Tax=Afifella sp. JA880 TaxID=2975280 RepID=UPI0021BA891B|nr:cellulose biosynthesis cyclic di-GMP-binding regulatory protein BcsB [Afifella sp. JA880]MCT8266422.1 cellulose biosynthesis cyclic di-GMP-binding regulatory protein BcsB [Afifella sp. JA880]
MRNLATAGLALLLLAPQAQAGKVVLSLDQVRSAAPVRAQPTTSQMALSDTGVPLVAEVDPDLRRLPAALSDLHFNGETAGHEWPVYLTRTQAASRAEMQLGYINSVSVMSEGSTLTVTVNEVSIGEIPIASPDELARTRLSVPPGLLQPGYNSVRISVQQRHRVDCSLEGTYELWTQIYPGVTGFAFAGAGAGFERLSDLAAVNPALDGAVSISVRAPETPTPKATERFLRVAEIAAIMTKAPRSEVRFDTGPVSGPGVEIAIGTPEELRRLGVLKPGETAQPGVSVILPDEMDLIHGRVSIWIVGGSDAAINAALASLEAGSKTGPSEGTPSGLRAAENALGHLVPPGSSVSLRDLGVVSEEFNGRLYRTSFNIRMPYDFLSADYSQAVIRLTAGFAPRLDPKSQLLVRVNDQTASVLPLLDDDGALMRGRKIPIPLKVLHPGINRVQIEAQLRSQSDRSCDTLAGLSSPSRFLIMDTSEFYLPPVARIARMPNLASTLSGGFPYAKGETTAAYIPDPDADTLSAAGTLAANLAAVSGAPLNLEVAFSAPPADAGTSIVVAAALALPGSVADAVGLDAAGMRQAWRSQMLNSRVGRAGLGEAPLYTGSTGRDDPTPQRASQRLFMQPSVSLDDWTEQMRENGGFGGPFERAISWLKDQVGSATGNIGLGEGPDPLRVKPGSTLVLAQAEAPANEGRTWTVVTAPTSGELAASVAQINTASLLYRLDGRALAFGRNDGDITRATNGSFYYVTTQPLSFQNIRLVAAGWMSLNIVYYVLGLIAACACLGLATTALLRRVGHSS